MIFLVQFEYLCWLIQTSTLHYLHLFGRELVNVTSTSNNIFMSLMPLTSVDVIVTVSHCHTVLNLGVVIQFYVQTMRDKSVETLP